MKRIFACLIALMLMPCACAERFLFSDALGRDVGFDSAATVAIASGSIAECWLLAGGEVGAVTRDAVEERNLPLPEDVIDLGSLKNPSLEIILKEKPGLLMLMPTLDKHLNMSELLDRAGINYAYFSLENFDEYLSLLDLFTDITGDKDRYNAYGASLIPRIEKAIARSRRDGARALVLRTSSVKIKALGSDSMVGQMLEDFGCANIADGGLLAELSLEAIVRADPDYIFIVCMGEEDEARVQLENAYAANPLWNRLTAVQNGRCHYLDKELFHYKPNARWGESYETLAKLLA